MKAAVFTDESGLELVDRVLSEPAPGWVKLDISAVGICGTDLHIKHGALGSPAEIQPGHEVSGIVDVCGEGVSLAPGTAVVLEPVLGCGDCRHCRAGMPNRCAQKLFFGHTRHGGMAESMLVPVSLLYPFNAELPTAVATLAEPAAVCVRGLRRGGVEAGQKLAVIGAGTIGLLSILNAKALGIEEIHVCARYPHQQAMASQLGASRVYGDAAAMLKTLGDEYLDVVIETVGGTAGTLRYAVTLAATGSTIVLLGAYLDDPKFPALRFMTHEHTLVASNCHGHGSGKADMEVAIELVSRYRQELAAMVTHRFKLDQVSEAFAVAEDKARESIKVQISP